MKRINVTQAYLPPIEEYQAQLEKIWQTGWLTNQGPLLHELETSTEKFLGVEDLQLVSNGTVALQLAFKALGIEEGEVITTPFSFVATTSAILWEKLTPVFVDIEPDTFCIDVNKIEQAITPHTKVILAVHVFGNPCDVDAINAIAKKHDLKVIYDAAHAFGVKYKGESLLRFGDISTLSFHSTKLFHTVEGGGVVTSDPKTSKEIDLLKKFGFEGDTYHRLGINAKNSEFHAAMGLCLLGHISRIIEKRKTIHHLYDSLLGGVVRIPTINELATHNYSYYPVLFENENQLLEALKRMNNDDVYPRRYFYPSLNKLPYLEKSQPCFVSEDISRRILCLPLYPDLPLDEVRRICRLIKAE